MKQILSFSFFFLAISFCFAQFPENFDSELPESWAVFIGENGEGPVQNWSYDDNGFVFSLFEEVLETSEDWLVTPQVAITDDNSILSFDFTDANSENFGSQLQIRVSTGMSQTTRSDFEILSTFTEDNVTALSLSRVQINLEDYIGQSIYVAFVHVQNDGDTFVLDNVNFEKLLVAPDAVINPTPENQQTDVVLSTEDLDQDGAADNSVTFSWSPSETGGEPQFYDFYFGTSPEDFNLLGTVPATQTALVLGGLQPETTYLWGVVARNNGGDALETTSLWFFTTASTTLSTDNSILEKQDVSYFYNSNTEELNIETQNNNFNKKIILYNFLGKQVLEQNLKEYQEKINVSNLVTGSYFGSILINNKKVKTIKFIKN